MKRKRKYRADDDVNSVKRHKTNNVQISHPVLEKYYGQVSTLRDYLLAALPSTSRHRKNLLRRNSTPNDDTPLVQELLDGIIVCNVQAKSSTATRAHVKDSDRRTYSQQMAESTGESVSKSQMTSQAEHVDIVIWTLFNRLKVDEYRPHNLLCYGITRIHGQNKLEANAQWTIPGLVLLARNEYVEELKSPLWTKVLELLGGRGGEIMTSMLLNCSLFKPIEGLTGIYCQISGRPLSEELLLPVRKPEAKLDSPLSPKASTRRASDIRFVRHRMLYAKGALNRNGEASFGLRHIHVLNRFTRHTEIADTVHIMKYIFPRQFGLHNVFTSTTDSKETSQAFKDYTLREEEIAKADRPRKIMNLSTAQLPKRLRGRAFDLIQSLQLLHKRCSYSQLFAHYCSANEINHTSTKSITDIATPAVQVSAFVRAVISRVWPRDLFGSGEDGEQNWRLLMTKVDAFIFARRYETISLDSVMSGMKITCIDWLCSSTGRKDQKLARSDHDKRIELFAELIYYLFDSFIVPLIRSNFYVTESSQYRNRLFYFRHDVWRRLTEPALAALKMSMLEEVPSDTALKTLTRRALGFSQIRLLPKVDGMRPISNLRRRAQIVKNGKAVLGRSINSVLAPVFNVLNYEKDNQAGRLGSSLFSVSGMFSKLQSFRSDLAKAGLSEQPLYIVKVDVQAAFDSIPQDAIQQLVLSLLSEEHYSVTRHAEVKPPDSHGAHNADVIFKPTRKFCATATGGQQVGNFVAGIKARPPQSLRHNTIFVDSIVPDSLKKSKVVSLLNEHIGANIVRIGKKFYRQKKGIPQGSVLSSLLCNLFYGSFELEQLAFLKNDKHSLLLRLIDDFLLITTSKDHAVKFLHIMHAGVPAYGINVKPEKSLVNFRLKVNSIEVPKLQKDRLFPYCGMLLDPGSLDISKDHAASRRHGTVIDALTVEYSRSPGRNLRRKTMAALKIQLHTMLLSTGYNSYRTVVLNLYHCMTDVASKTLAYIRCFAKDGAKLCHTLKDTVSDLVALAFAMMKSNRNKLRSPDYRCGVSRSMLQCLSYRAFALIFNDRQALHGLFIKWLKDKLELATSKCSRRELSLLRTI